MSETSIQWTDYTFNPWWGCQRVSPGCENCYAETFDHRLGGKHWGPEAPHRFFGEHHWNEPLRWDRARQRGSEKHRVFCASMADVFEDRRDLDSPRERLWILIEKTRNLTWQLLTKRPQNVQGLTPKLWQKAWPSHVWLGVTAEDQQRADERIPLALQTSAATVFVSYEPALGPISFRWAKWDTWNYSAGKMRERVNEYDGLRMLDQVIVGGESGHGARPFNLAWALDVAQECRAAGVAFFYKQGGASNRCEHDPKGGHVECFPPALRIREFPA